MAKSKIILMVGAVVAVLVLVICVLMVGREMSKLTKNQKTLGKMKRDVEAFCEKDPYPSTDNVQVQQQNLETVAAKFDEMLALLSKSSVAVPTGTPSGFSDRLAKVRKALLSTAQTSGTRLPDGFAFGFDEWASGALPKAGQLDGLNNQLSVASTLSGILLQEGCVELTRLVREALPEPAPVPAEGEEMLAEALPVEEGGVEESSRFQRIRFTVEFVVKEPQLFGILNRLAADSMFLVVSSVTIAKDVPDVRMPAVSTEDSDGSGVAETGANPMDRVLVSGSAVDGGMRVTMVVDAYNFPPAASEETPTEAVSVPAGAEEES